ncbi:MAG: DUF4914 family protein, partial [Candidatus Omnitrophica bacterium]|nr:DUF4914 family protein [Candidatus Omnitrophota bacterium]
MADRIKILGGRVFLPPEVAQILTNSPKVVIPASRHQLADLSLGGEESGQFEVGYEVPGKGRVVEAKVIRARNGVAVNYMEPYMRRRDPDCMVVADSGPTDKSRFSERFEGSFQDMRQEVFDWLGRQEVLVLPFMAGKTELGCDALLIAPLNAAFFATGLADLQGMIPENEIPEGFHPRAIIYLAPPFRHTHCQGRQIVIHNRMEGLHELFSLNLYPGPSAKKGIYGVLLSIGESEGWLTAHGSTVQVVTPYDNIVTIMH